MYGDQNFVCQNLIFSSVDMKELILLWLLLLLLFLWIGRWCFVDFLTLAL